MGNSSNTSKISLPVIKRLPRYYRYVRSLMRQGVTTVSSSELAAILGTTASQVRQDFNCFGGFGQQGVGYNVQALNSELENLLFSGSKLPTILIGTGRLGRTISGFIDQEAKGFALIAAFDSSPEQIGSYLGELQVRDVEGLAPWCQEHKPQVAVLCIPAKSASALAPSLLSLGIKGFWNFTHYDFATDNKSGVVIENVHLSDSLSSLGYRVRNPLG